MLDRQLRLNCIIWWSLCFVISVEIIAMAYLGLVLDITHITNDIPVMAGASVAALCFRLIKRDHRLSLFTQSFIHIMLGNFALNTGSYLGAYCNMPLADNMLVKIDMALGFDWMRYLAWVDENPLWANILSLSYDSLVSQITFIIPLLFFRHAEHAQRVIATLLAAGMIIIVISAFFPAVGGYIYYNVSPAKYYDIILNPLMFAHTNKELLFGLFHHSVTTLPYNGQGIVIFPSYHSAIAVGLMYAALPYKPLWLIVIPLNILVLLSTPVFGGHWLIDIISGIFVALMGIYFSEKILPRTQPL